MSPIFDGKIPKAWDHSLIFRGHGKTRARIFFIHGWTSTPFEISFAAKYLASRGFEGYGYMLAGHGKTPEELNRETWKSVVQKLSRRLREYGDAGPYFLWGSSMGGSLASYIASLAEFQPRIRGLLLFAPSFFFNSFRPSYFSFSRPSLQFVNIIKYFRPIIDKQYRGERAP